MIIYLAHAALEMQEMPVSHRDVAPSGPNLLRGLLTPPTASCEECKRLFETHQQLWEHICTAATPTRGFCPICTQSMLVEEIRFHLERNHANEIEGRKLYICDECGQPFLDLNKFATHKKVIHKIDHRCPSCNKLFINVDTLLYHEANCTRRAPSQNSPSRGVPKTVPTTNNQADYFYNYMNFRRPPAMFPPSSYAIPAIATNYHIPTSSNGAMISILGNRQLPCTYTLQDHQAYNLYNGTPSRAYNSLKIPVQPGQLDGLYLPFESPTTTESRVSSSNISSGATSSRTSPIMTQSNLNASQINNDVEYSSANTSPEPSQRKETKTNTSQPSHAGNQRKRQYSVTASKASKTPSPPHAGGTICAYNTTTYTFAKGNSRHAKHNVRTKYIRLFDQSSVRPKTTQPVPRWASCCA